MNHATCITADFGIGIKLKQGILTATMAYVILPMLQQDNRQHQKHARYSPQLNCHCLAFKGLTRILVFCLLANLMTVNGNAEIVTIFVQQPHLSNWRCGAVVRVVT